MNLLSYIQSKIVTDSKQLEHVLSMWKFTNQKIVFTNGCFDILHKGHVNYLAQAASKGDKLIVALNTDRSIKEIKGDNRPINNEIARAEVMAALAFVDLVVFFDESTPINIITDIVPNVLVKGADYEIKDIVGYDVVTQNGGEVITIPFVEGYSTTQTLSKMNS